MASSRQLFSFLLILLLAALGGLLYFMLRDLDAPELTLMPERERVSNVTEFMVEARDVKSGVKSLRVKVIQNDVETLLLEKTYPEPVGAVLEKFSIEETLPQDFSLHDGDFTLVVVARDGSFANFGQGMLARLLVPYVLDTVPPKVSIVRGSSSIRQGGAAIVAYNVAETPGKSGVTVDDLFFPGYRQKDGAFFCIFPFPHFMDTENYRPRLTVWDKAGNLTSRNLSLNRLAQRFKQDKLHLPDSFLESKMPEFEKDFPGQMSHLERFIKVNRQLRTLNRDALYDLALDTAPSALWKGTFLRMPRAATKATFGDRRTYIHQDKEVDNQIHLGVDLASVRHDNVPAANAGRVVFAGVMGIYGQVVIIDHGLGLQSLYGHLSEMHVDKGETVTRGQIVGKTGVSGLAGGDHLHFGIIVGGVPVNPIEWWDKNWLKITYGDVLKDVGLE
jgi:murein DD-endopeptidase MepM/ murein hydrolase activator NlpD